MKQMKIPRGTARSIRRATGAGPSAQSKSAAIATGVASIRSHVRKLGIALFHKAATAKTARNSPFA
ncbi:hypothetical protein ACQ4WP_26810 [Janthinobacterium sp. GB4P2]|uniref:hypothetical protein n=1 Tax=Janthinobacterium sp. GB4P2 TaxID=3424189 RepID=UPI003F2001F6